MTLRLVVADDHALVLEGLRALLSLGPDLDVVAICANGLEVVDAVREHRPDVLVVDAVMPECDGLSARARLLDAGLAVPTVLLAASLDDETLLRCLRSGVEALVLKESAVIGLVEAIHAVSRGERLIPPLLMERAMDVMAREGREDDGYNQLTPREREVVQCVARGQSNKRAASELGITPGTVKLHLHRAFRKLSVSNRLQLSLLARERGWF